MTRRRRRGSICEGYSGLVEKMGDVYQLIFADGRSYIGITTKTAAQRYAAHSRQAKCGRSVVYEAWRRLGPPQLVILQELPDKNALAAAEVRWIAELGTFVPGGYNSTFGGETSPSSTPLVARKISEQRKGIKFSPQHLLNLSLAHRGKPSPKKGIAMSDEQRSKLKEAWKRRRLFPESEETRRKKSIASTGRWHRPVTRERIRAARIAYWAARRNDAPAAV